MALWVTNRERLRSFVDLQLLAAWRLQHVATWYWVKVDAESRQPVMPLAGMHRHPYEQLLLCRPIQAKGGQANQVCEVLQLIYCSSSILKVPHFHHAHDTNP